MYQKGKVKEKIPFELHIILFLLPFIYRLDKHLKWVLNTMFTSQLLFHFI
jgi:hypothetical protein